MKKFNTQVSRSQYLRHVFLISLLFVLAACSSIKLSYNHGDTLLYWWLDAYVDLDSDQKAWVKQDIDQLFQWHRKTQLKDYVQVLANGQKQLQGNVTPADLMSDYRDILRRTQVVLMKAAPDLATLARSLTPEQIAQMEKKFASNNEQYRKKFLSGDTEKRQKYRYQKSMEQFELWFGSFNREQEAAIRTLSDARPLDNQAFLSERMLRQKNVLELVRKVQREKPTQETTEAMVQNLIRQSFEQFDHSEHKAFYDAYTNGTIQMIAGVIKMLTPAQKAHGLRRMQGWIDDFNSLAAEAH
jgi:uncharacterized protein YaaW (UPF0174 family)